MAVTRHREKANANHGHEPRIRLSLFRLTRLAARVVFFPFFRVRTEGLFHLPRKGPFILLPKHQRWEDIPLLGMVVPRPLFYIAKHELFQTPHSRLFITSLGGIPLNRKRPLESRRSIRKVQDLLGRGEGVVIFPEGTYYPQRMGPGRHGLIRRFRGRMEVPCIPAGICYLAGRLPKKVQIRFGEPVPAESPDGLDFHERVMREIARLSGLYPIS